MYDLLIIGSGIAGLTTALEAGKSGMRVLLVTKERLEESNTWYAQGGIAAALGDDDTPDSHFEDTLAAGAGLCDPDAVRVLVNEGPAAVRRLATLGVPFDRHGSTLALTREAAHSQRRIVHAGGDATGAAVETTLADAVRAAGIEVREQTAALDLLVENGVCVGALLTNTNQHNTAITPSLPQPVRAHAVVLATGGAGQLYQATTNPAVATGDGIALAYRTGAAIANMEFFQFHPTALYSGPSAGSVFAPAFLISEAVRGEGGYLRNAAGERFMLRVHQQAELAPRDVVARAIATEMLRTEADCVYLDVTHLDHDLILHRFPTIARVCASRGIDITREPIPVAPAAHYMMGGVVSDLWGRTTLPGLYACGEVAMTGVHGANRLASNSLLEGAVWGARITRAAGEWCKQPNMTWSDEQQGGLPTTIMAGPTLSQTSDTTAHDSSAEHVRDLLPRLMWRHVGMMRDEKGLQTAIDQINVWRAASPTHSDMLLVAALVAQSALLREESRGAHARIDYPEPRPTWRRVIALRRPDGE